MNAGRVNISPQRTRRAAKENQRLGLPLRTSAPSAPSVVNARRLKSHACDFPVTPRRQAVMARDL